MRFLSETRAVWPPAKRSPPSGSDRAKGGWTMRELEFLGVSDLAVRWQYTQQGVNKLARSSGFPAPAFTLNAGRVRVWGLAAIESFERAHPEVTSPTEKRRKIYGYFRAVSKGKQPEGEAGSDGA